MESVSKEQLTGYRQPTESEKAGIQKYVLKDLKGEQRLFGIISIVSGITAISLSCFAGESLYKHSLELVRVLAVMVFVFISFGLFLFTANICSKNRKIISDIRQGRFGVLDCVSENIDPKCDISAFGFASIRTIDGVNCSDRFHIDLRTACEYEGRKGVPMLLMCQPENQYYELFTAYKLNGR